MYLDLKFIAINLLFDCSVQSINDCFNTFTEFKELSKYSAHS